MRMQLALTPATRSNRRRGSGPRIPSSAVLHVGNGFRVASAIERASSVRNIQE